MLKVVHIQRSPNSADYSIERVFASVRKHFSSNVQCQVARSPFRSRGVVRRLANVIRASLLRGDLFHVTGDVQYLVLVLPARRTVLTVHDCGTLSSLHGYRKAIYKWVWMELPLRRAGAITCVSELTRSQLVEQYPYCVNKVVVIPNVVPEDYLPSARPFCAQNPRILQIGTRARKNLESVVEALVGIPCTLHIIGELSQAQRQLLERSGVPFEASEGISDEEMHARYLESDMVVFVSKEEGFGLPIIEANAVGRPVVTSNLAPMTEVANGAACLVDPLDVRSIRRGILRVMEDAEYRDLLIRKGFENVSRFRPNEVARQYERLYAELLSAAAQARDAKHNLPLAGVRRTPRHERQ